MRIIFLGLILGLTAAMAGGSEVSGSLKPRGPGNEKPFFQAQLIFRPTLRFPRCHSSTIIALPDGSLLAAWWNGSEEGWSDVANAWTDTGNNLVLRASRRPAGEKSWEPPWIIVDTPDSTNSNPVFFIAPRGELWLFSRVGAPWFKLIRIKSTDMGRIWGEPEVFWNKPGWSLRSSIIQLENGDIFIPSMSYPPSDDRFTNSLTAFIYSDDGGKTWKRTKCLEAEPACNEASVIQRSDGSLLTFIRPHDIEPADRFIMQSESFDQGRTWSRPSRTAIRNPSCAIELLKLRSGRVALAFNNTQSSRSHLCLALSLDEGRTWSFKRTLEDSPGRFSYPTLTQSAEGHIHVSYTFRRTHVKHVEVNEAWIMEEPWHDYPD